MGIALLGCTGSIGTHTLDVLRGVGPGYRVVTLAAGRDAAGLLAAAAALPQPPQLLALGDAAAPAATDAQGRPIPRGEAALVECPEDLAGLTQRHALAGVDGNPR